MNTKTPVNFTLHIRLPWWIKGNATICINEKEEMTVTEKTAFYALSRTWQDGDSVRILLPQGITAWPLPEDKNMVAFLYGPVLLVGLCDEERRLELNGMSPEQLLANDNEREWGNWKDTFKTIGQERGISFVPLYDVGYETYTTYFPIR